MILTAQYCGVPCKNAKPTKRHRLAIWENILGTVYACNDQGVVKYFDYDYESAKQFSGVSQERDPRLYKNSVNYQQHNKPRVGQLVMYIRKSQ